jgi:DNA-binding NarL/FixJ family response regulator
VPEAEPTRVVVVDDDVVLTEALSLVWEREGDLQIVGLAHTGADGLALSRREQPQVVLMDYRLPDTTGTEAAAKLSDELPGTAVVIMTIDPSDQAMLEAVESGASGFLSKTQGVQAVTDAVRRAAGGEMLIPAATIARLLALARDRRRREHQRQTLQERLTARELEVLQLMAQGLDTRALVERLVLSQTTVRTHVAAVLAKLDAHSRLEAVVKASELGLLRPTGSDAG